MDARGAVARQVRIRARRHRTLDDRLIVRFPAVYAHLARAVTKLHPTSRIRRAFVRRGAESMLAATNRRDYAAVLPRYHPDVEFVPAGEAVSLGFATSYRGRQGFLEIWDAWDSSWSGHVQYTGAEVTDHGDRFVTTVRMKGVGAASGINVEMTGTLVHTIQDGLLIREEQHIRISEPSL